MQPIVVSKSSWRRWPDFASSWEDLHNLCPGASFFLSREWVDCWLATFGKQLNPDLLTFVAEGKVVGCCLLVARTQWVKGIPLRRLYLNCAGENETDSTCIEYNSLLTLPEYAEPAAKALVAFLRKRHWDELLLNGVVEQPALYAAVSTLGRLECSERPCHYVDLRHLRHEGTGFDGVLSPNTRQQIRRSKRLYEQASGSCCTHVAGSVKEAIGIFTRLANLHQVSWQQRGRPGVFASPKFVEFHRKLIEAAFDRDKIMLMEVQTGGDVIGALYAFLHRGRVYFYQSGFHYTSDNRVKPGLLSHYLAIQHCFGQSTIQEYDFLAGDSQYKRSLATATRDLRWTIVRRPTVPSLLFRGLRYLKRTYAHIHNESRQSSGPDYGRQPSADVPVQNAEAGKLVSRYK